MWAVHFKSDWSIATDKKVFGQVKWMGLCNVCYHSSSAVKMKCFASTNPLKRVAHMGMIEGDNDGLYYGDDEIYSSFAVSTWWASRSNGGSDLPWMSEPLSFVCHVYYETACLICTLKNPPPPPPPPQKNKQKKPQGNKHCLSTTLTIPPETGNLSIALLGQLRVWVNLLN